MDDIKLFVEKFAEIEARLITVKRTPNIELYNTLLKEFNGFFVELLHGAMGHMHMDKPYDDEDYEFMAGYPDDTPRLLFKISEYSHSTYGKIWIAYVSPTNANLSFRALSYAFIIIEENSTLKIENSLLYSNYTERAEKNAPYYWHGKNSSDLNFDTLGKPTKIERYLAPDSWPIGMAIYSDNI